MKKLLAIALTVFFAACSSDNEDAPPVNEEPVAACVFNGDVTLTTQAEVDAFVTTGYCVVKNLTIGPYSGFSDITNLNTLLSLTEVENDLIIQNVVFITNLEGLNNIVKVGNNLIIQGNTSLTDMTALSSLTSLAELSVIENKSLANLNGLQGLTTLYDARIEKNKNLQNLSGLENIKKIYGQINIKNNPQYFLTGLGGLEEVYSLIIDSSFINSFSGLSNLKSCGILTLIDCPDIKSFEGLQNVMLSGLSLQYTGIESFAGLENVNYFYTLDISNNAHITTLNGLDNLEFIQYLNISDNDALTSLAGLSSVKTIGYLPQKGQLYIDNNDELTSLAGLENINTFDAGIRIFQNSALKDFCTLSPFIASGIITEDELEMIYLNDYNPTYLDFANGNCSIN